MVRTRAPQGDAGGYHLRCGGLSDRSGSGYFGIPEWAFRFVVLMLVVFFPVAIVIAWAFELTPDGIKATKSARADPDRETASPKDQSRRNMRTVVFAAALPTLIFGALAVFFFFSSGPFESERNDSATRQGSGQASSEQIAEMEKSIAVLPLQNLSPDPENAFFADGVQEDILTNLSKIEELLVISRSSTLRYRERNKSLKEIGAELEVRYLVGGGLRSAGGQSRVGDCSADRWLERAARFRGATRPDQLAQASISKRTCVTWRLGLPGIAFDQPFFLKPR